MIRWTKSNVSWKLSVLKCVSVRHAYWCLCLHGRNHPRGEYIEFSRCRSMYRQSGLLAWRGTHIFRNESKLTSLAAPARRDEWRDKLDKVPTRWGKKGRDGRSVWSKESLPFVVFHSTHQRSDNAFSHCWHNPLKDTQDLSTWVIEAQSRFKLLAGCIPFYFKF